MDIRYGLALPDVKSPVRRALREMVACAVIAAIFMLLIIHKGNGLPLDGGERVAAILTGFLFSPLLWAAYRLACFIVGR